MDITSSLIMVSFQVLLACFSVVMTYFTLRYQWSRVRRLKECRTRIVSILQMGGCVGAEGFVVASNHKLPIVLETLDKLESEDMVRRAAQDAWKMTKHGHWVHSQESPGVAEIGGVEFVIPEEAPQTNDPFGVKTVLLVEETTA